MRVSALSLLLVPLVAACDGGPTGTEKPPQPVAGITAVAGHGVSDTVDARPVAALTVQVLSGSPALPANGVVVRFEPVPVKFTSDFCPAGCTTSSMWVAGLTESEFRSSGAATTNAEGKASIRIAFGRAAGEGKILVTVPELGMQDTVRYTVQPGAPAIARLMPRDTSVYVQRSFRARPVVADRYGNPRAEVPTLVGAGLGVDGLTVTGARYGAFRLRAEMPGVRADSILVSVMPEGTLSYVASQLTVMNLDGTGRTTIDLGGNTSGYDWSPDGRTLYAAVFNSSAQGFKIQVVAAGGAKTRLAVNNDAITSEFAPQLSADGQWVYFIGSMGGREAVLYRVKADGSGAVERLLETAPSINYWYAQAYAVSPDGSRVATADNDGIKMTDLATRTTRVVTTAFRPSFLRWSPSGEWIALGFETSVAVMKPDGTGTKTLAGRYYPGDLTIDWSPDSKWLAYVGDRNYEIVEVATGTRIPLPITSATRLAFKP